MEPSNHGVRPSCGVTRCPAWGSSVLSIAAIFVLAVATHAQASDLKYVSKSKVVPSVLPTLDGRGVAVAKCPKDHPKVTGGGVKIIGDNSNFDLEVGTTLPQEDARPNEWLGEANNSSGSEAQMTTTAICAKGRLKYPGRSRNIPPGGQATKRVACPSGTKLTGGGVSTEGASPRVEVAASKPFDGPDGNKVPDDGWLGSANNGTSSGLTLNVNAICAKSGDYKYVESATKPLPDNAEASAVASCPDGTTVSGGGVENSGIDIGAEIESSFPLPDQDWVGRANNDNTGQTETVQAFAICLISKTRNLSGPAGGGTVTLKSKFEDGKTVKVLRGLRLDDIPVACSNQDTVHSVSIDIARNVKHNTFSFHTDSEIGQRAAGFKVTGRFNKDGTKASGTFREQGNLKSSNSTFVFTHCDTGVVHWTAQVR